MRSATIIILLLNFFYSVDSFYCVDQFENQNLTNPKNCCSFPFLSEYQIKDLEKQQKECESPNSCCSYDLFFSVLKIYEDEKFQRQNFINLILNGTDENYQNEWKDVIEKSAEKCENLCELLLTLNLISKLKDIFSVPWTQDENESCSTPVYMLYLIACVFHENFLNCPNLNSTDECSNVVNYLKNEPCGFLDGDKRVVDCIFWSDW